MGVGPCTDSCDSPIDALTIPPHSTLAPPNRLVNMELLQSYAPDVWLLYNQELERFKGQLDKELEGLRKEADMVRFRLVVLCCGVGRFYFCAGRVAREGVLAAGLTARPHKGDGPGRMNGSAHSEPARCRLDESDSLTNPAYIHIPHDHQQTNHR